jgi:L-lactate dehydrogenase
VRKLWTDCIDINVLGESFSDNQVVCWSTATIGGAPIDEMLPPDRASPLELALAVRRQAINTISHKGAATVSIATIILMLCSAVLGDKRESYPLSHHHEELGCCISTPAVIGRAGVLASLPLQLDSEELLRLKEAAEALRGEQMEWP